MKYSVGWYRDTNERFIVQITENVFGWFDSILDAKLAAARFLNQDPMFFQVIEKNVSR